MSEAISPLLQELVDKEQIREVIAKYCRGVDRFDWDLVRGCYHEDGTDDHGIFNGSAEDFIAWSEEFLPGWTERTQHLIANCLIELDGDAAGAETYAVGFHRGVPPGESERMDVTIGARFVDRLARRDGQWAITERRLAIEWTRIDAVGRGFDLPPECTFGTRDRSDASYAVFGG